MKDALPIFGVLPTSLHTYRYLPVLQVRKLLVDNVSPSSVPFDQLLLSLGLARNYAEHSCAHACSLHQPFHKHCIMRTHCTVSTRSREHAAY